jgi:hypothetical protein
MDLSLITRFPQDLQRRILSYTYRTQPPALLEDIQSFVESKKELLRKYHEFWIVQLDMSVPEDKRWLLNDFFYYANQHKATMFGYSDLFYQLFLRRYGMDTVDAVEVFVRKLGKKEVDTQINVVLGLFTPAQRDDFWVNTMAT